MVVNKPSNERLRTEVISKIVIEETSQDDNSSENGSSDSDKFNERNKTSPLLKGSIRGNSPKAAIACLGLHSQSTLPRRQSEDTSPFKQVDKELDALCGFDTN